MDESVRERGIPARLLKRQGFFAGQILFQRAIPVFVRQGSPPGIDSGRGKEIAAILASIEDMVCHPMDDKVY